MHSVPTAMDAVPRRILLVDDDAEVRAAMAKALSREGFVIGEAPDGASALEQLCRFPAAVVVLDVDMPRMNGWKTLDELRARGWKQPVLMVTHVNDPESRVRGLEGGADDYIGKPFVADELVARVRALLRRAPDRRPRPPVLTFGAVVVDLAQKSARDENGPVRLTRTEFALLSVLAAQAGTPVSRDDLFAKVWSGKAGQSHTLDTHIWRLRRKLGDRGDDGGWILNHPGQGFSLSPSVVQGKNTAP